jgi:putative ABC transport system substrate-binding protein
MQLLKEILPQMTQVAFLTNLQNPVARNTIRLMETNAQSLNVALQVFSVRARGEFARTFDLIEQHRIQAVVIAEDGIFVTNYAQVAALALARRLLSVGSPEAARLGVTIGYGADTVAMFHSAAVFIDKIFKGAKPADLPIQRATNEFVLNLKTAKALGLDPPTTTLFDEIIE